METVYPSMDAGDEALLPQAELDTAPESDPLDPRAAEMSNSLVGLLNAALGIWRDTVDSQDRLSKAVDQLQEEINDIKEFSALPIFRAGLPLLESNINRVQACKKRIASVGARLKRIDNGLQPYRQRMKLRDQQAKVQAETAKPAPKDPPPAKEPDVTEAELPPADVASAADAPQQRSPE
jgi:hypothetical protein